VQASDLPYKLILPWASSAPGGNVTNPIPPTSQIGITNGAASLPDGFPPLNFIPVGSGGTPPFGKDFNGAFFIETSWTRWLSAGGPIKWDSAFSAAVSGYMQGAIVQSATTFGQFYICLVDNNTSNPDTGGAGWFKWSPFGVGVQDVTASGAFVTKYQSVRLYRTSALGNSSTTLPTSPVDGEIQWYSDAGNNLALYPLTVNPAGGQSIVGFAGPAVLAQNGMVARFEWDALASSWILFTESAGNNYYGPNDTGTADAVVVSPSPAIPALTAGVILNFIKGANPNATATPTVAPNGLAAKVITRDDGSAVEPGDLPAGALIPVQYDGVQWRLLWGVTPQQVKIKLQGNLTLYIRTDGNDNNNGLTNTPSGAFQTIQGAWNATFSLYDTNGFTIIYQLGIAGTYDGAVFSGNSGSFILNGNNSAPTTYIVRSRNASAIANNITVLQGSFLIQNLKLDYTYNSTVTSEATVIASQGGQVFFGINVTFNCANNRTSLWECSAAGAGSEIIFAYNGSATLSITGAGQRQAFSRCVSGAVINCTNAPGTNATFTSGGVAITYADFILADILSSQSWVAALFSTMSVTGAQYNINRNSVLALSGVTIPGTPGTTANGGIAI
jgi:hypothetical protein